MPPAAIAVAAVGAAAGIIGSTVAASSGAGKSKYAARNFSETPDYNANKFEYGGRPGEADAAAGRFGESRQNLANQSNALYGQSNLDHSNALTARQGLVRGAGRLEQRALGNNLISNQVADNARTNLIAEGSSAQASARGPAGLALAQQSAGNATSAGLTGIASNEMVAASQEQIANEQATQSAYGNIRGGDDASRSASLQGSTALANAGATYGGLENDVRKTQLQGGIADQQTLANSHNQVTAIDSGTQSANAQKDLEYVKMGAGAVSGALQSGATMAGGKADGGPVVKGKPYLVGERGPEMIVPVQDGIVVPNEVAFEAPSKTKGLGEDFNYRQFMGDMDSRLADAAEKKRNEPKSFKRDSKADQKKVGEAYYASLMAEADQLKASLAAAKDSGPSVRRLASGSPETNHETELTSGAEEAFQRKFGNADTSDYDLRGAYAGGATEGQPYVLDGDSNGVSWPDHLPDTWKKPNHPTMSNESLYAQMPPASDPAAKAEAFNLGRAQGAFEAHRAKADEKDQEAMSQNRASMTHFIDGMAFPPAMLLAAHGQYQTHKALNEADDAAERAAFASRAPRVPRSANVEGAKGLVIQSGKDQEGVPTKAGTADDMFAYHSDLKTPYQIPDYRFAEPEQTLGAQAALASQQGQSGWGPIRPPSDPRAKNLGAAQDNEVARTLDATPAVSYKYKDPKYEPDAQRPGERQAGFLTTDLKKTPLGAAVVEERPDGLDGYNQHRMIGLQHAEIQNLHERLRALETPNKRGR